jgi:hypothetical protein
MARILSSNIVIVDNSEDVHGEACTEESSHGAATPGAAFLPATSPITQAIQALLGPQVRVLDLPAPEAYSDRH